jgi:hypothetical protein
MVALDEQSRRRRVDQDDVAGGEPEVDECCQLDPQVEDPFHQPREHGRLCRPHKAQRGTGEQVGTAHGRRCERNGEQEQPQVSPSPEVRRKCEYREDRGDDQERTAFAALRPEEQHRAEARQDRRGQHHRGLERLQRGSRAEMETDARREQNRRACRRGEQRTDGRLSGMLGRQREHLWEDHDRRRDEQRFPLLVDGHDGGRREHERDEAVPGGRHPVAPGDRYGNGEGADDADSGDELRRPGKREGPGHDGNAPRKNQGRPVRNQVVVGTCSEQGRVGATDPGPDRGHCSVRLAESPPQQQPSAEDERRGAGAEGDARSFADPAAIDGQGEEEDDPEQGHDPTSPGERAGSEPVGRAQVMCRPRARLVPTPCRRRLRRGLRRLRRGGRRRPGGTSPPNRWRWRFDAGKFERLGRL